MRLTYDPRHNIAYIRFRERAETEDVETIVVSDEVNIDIGADGRLFGIELLNANVQLQAADSGRLVVVDSSGQEQAISLAT
jgi:uncharacterized protein YuzE